MTSNQKPRIAIQLFGHLRTFQKTFENFKKYVLEPNKLDGYEIDIFIHTWNKLNHSTVNFRNAKDVTLTDETLNKDSITIAKNLYQPKEILVEPQIKRDDFIINEKIGNFKRSILGCINNAYTIFRSNELREKFSRNHNINYEWVIVTRPDILFDADFRINDMFKAFREHDFTIPEKGLFYAFNPFGRKNKIEDPRFICGSDLIFFGKPEVITIASSLYEDFENNIDYNNFYCFEVWWHQFWLKKNLDTRAANFKHCIDFHIIRNSNDLPIIVTKEKDKKINKIIKEIVKILPYFIAKKILQILN